MTFFTMKEFSIISTFFLVLPLLAMLNRNFKLIKLILYIMNVKEKIISKVNSIQDPSLLEELLRAAEFEH